MKRYLDGDVSAFQVLLERHGRKVFHFILRNLGDRHVAEDLVQEVFLRVVHGASSFKEQSKFTTWLYTIARNLCIDTTRKARHRRVVMLDEPVSRSEAGGATILDRIPSSRPGPDTEVRDRRFRASLREALQQLPAEQREVFVMREFLGLKFREIADVVGVPENTVKSRMRYALEGLRGHLAAFAEAV